MAAIELWCTSDDSAPSARLAAFCPVFLVKGRTGATPAPARPDGPGGHAPAAAGDGRRVNAPALLLAGCLLALVDAYALGVPSDYGRAIGRRPRPPRQGRLVLPARRLPPGVGRSPRGEPASRHRRVVPRPARQPVHRARLRPL